MSKIINIVVDSNTAPPVYQTVGAAGLDLQANLKIAPEIYGAPTFLDGEPLLHLRELTIYPRDRVLIHTGLKVEIPEGYELQIRPRSGLALKHGLMLPNSPGTIDSDYRGDIGVIVINLGNKPIVIKHGMRIAQAVLTKVVKIEWNVVTDVDDTTRGDGGFGHTGGW